MKDFQVLLQRKQITLQLEKFIVMFLEKKEKVSI